MGKNIVKSILCWSLITIMLFVSAGCGNNKTIEDESNPTITRPTELKTIKICFRGFSETGQPENMTNINEMLAELNKKTEADLNTRIEFMWIPFKENTYEAQLIELLKSGNAPDAFMTDTAAMSMMSDEGLIMDITELYPVYAPHYFNMMVKTWGKELYNSINIDDKTYAVPSNTFNSRRYCVIARKDLVEKYISKGIKDLDDYCKFLKAVKENEDGIYPGIIYPDNFFDAFITGHGYFNYLPFTYSLWNGNEVNLMFMHQTDVYSTAYDLYKDLLDNDISNNDIHTSTSIGFASGKIASILSRMNAMSDYGSFIGSNEYAIYPLYMDSYCLRDPFHAVSLGINADSGSADRILMFIEWLQSSQENYEMLMYGIKDKNYALSGEFLDLTLFKAYRTSIAGWFGSEVFSNYLLDRRYSYEPEDYIKFREDLDFKNTKTYEEILNDKGYTLDTYRTLTAEELGAEYSKIYPSYDNIMNKYFEYFQTLSEGTDNGKTIYQMIEENGLQPEIDKVLAFYKLYYEQMKK